jgi:WhiB family redox-sensing transcriptional regulator
MDLDKANCKNENPDLFFPDDRGLYSTQQLKSAKNICASCEIKFQCLEFALKDDITEGIWGGLTYNERKPKHTTKARRRIPMTPEAAARLSAYKAKKHEESVRRSAYKIEQYTGALKVALATVTTEVPEANLTLAKIKIDNPDLTLGEVGALMDPPMSKDMAAGRLRRLLEASKAIQKAKSI